MNSYFASLKATWRFKLLSYFFSSRRSVVLRLFLIVQYTSSLSLLFNLIFSRPLFFAIVDSLRICPNITVSPDILQRKDAKVQRRNEKKKIFYFPIPSLRIKLIWQTFQFGFPVHFLPFFLSGAEQKGGSKNQRIAAHDEPELIWRPVENVHCQVGG